MRSHRFLYFAAGMLAIVGIAGASSLALRNDGILFPDGSLQTTAAPGIGSPVHAEGSLNIGDTDVCSPFTTLYTVPAAKNLVIEWVGIESNALNLADPVDVDIETDDGTTFISHPIVRLTDSFKFPGSLFFSQRWSDQVRLFSAPTETVRAQACRNGTTNDHGVRISFYGRLFDAPGP